MALLYAALAPSRSLEAAASSPFFTASQKGLRPFWPLGSRCKVGTAVSCARAGSDVDARATRRETASTGRMGDDGITTARSGVLWAPLALSAYPWGSLPRVSRGGIRA